MKIISQLSKKKRKEKKNLERIVLFGKDEVNIIYITYILISKALIYLCINHGNFFSGNNVLRENYEMKEEIKKSWSFRIIYCIKTNKKLLSHSQENIKNR